MSKDVVWRQMFGAKVQWPCDMPDDLLEDCITVTVEKLEAMEENEQDLQSAGVQISQVRVAFRVSSWFLASDVDSFRLCFA